ncbi:MAG TPA: hypothetical protein VH120_07780 [Gemmataceae bacterium]|nr:hypothetical protein [Gemmataceae bacterium]
MTNTDWIDLVRLIPQEQHNTLVVTTLTGVDLNVETILRSEETYMVFRGRISGITDEGRVFFVPYRQIDYLQMNRQVKEAEIRLMYGESPDAMAEGADVNTAETAGIFESVVTTSASRQGAMHASPATPSSPAPAVPSRPSLPGVAARLANAVIGRNSTPPQPTAANASEAPTPPRNSILERLRAQRNSVVSSKPPGR